MKSVVFILCLLTTLVNGGQHGFYKDFVIHTIKVNTRDEQKVILNVAAELDADVWSDGYPGVRDVVVMTSPEQTETFETHLQLNGLEHRRESDDVMGLLEKQDEEILHYKRSRTTKAATYEDYPRLSEVDEYIDQLALDYPNEVNVVTVGTSYEGRPMRYLKISTSNFTDASKPVIMMNSCIHAREWVTIPVNLYFLHRLLEERSPEDDDLLAGIDWIVFPVVNPDGYEYTHTTRRLWRKTRSPTSSRLCTGVDGNRNFDYNFGQYGVSSLPCSDIYNGVEPFSEVETQHVRDVMLQHRDRMELFIDIHSYGSFVLYGYDDVLAPNANQAHHMGSVMAAAIDVHKLPEGKHYLVGNAAFLLGPAAGNTQDYAQSIGARFSYTLELPGYSYFFVVPPRYINQINFETWHGLAAAARLAKVYYTASYQPSNLIKINYKSKYKHNKYKEFH